jgi:hypothetical protein
VSDVSDVALYEQRTSYPHAHLFALMGEIQDLQQAQDDDDDDVILCDYYAASRQRGANCGHCLELSSVFAEAIIISRLYV